MAAAKGSDVTEGWTKWQIGLAVGAPVVLGLAGIWYYRRSRRKQDRKKSIDRNQNADAGTSQAGSEKGGEGTSPSDQAQAQKNKGNKLFKGGKYDKAIECYTEAIQLCPSDNVQELSTFYHNRAAAYEQLKNPDEVVKDCTKALELNKRYIKALSRRAKACEQLGDLTQSLEDVTALCILEGFQNQLTLQMADRVLKELGKKKAHSAYKNRKPSVPSKQFVRAYFMAFKNDPIFNDEISLVSSQGIENGENILEENDKNIPCPFQKAVENLKAEENDDILRLCEEELENTESKFTAKARLLRATFYLLTGQADKALVDLNIVLKTDHLEKKVRVNALIKRGSLLLQQDKHTEGLDDFATAVRTDPDNADVYHHRGHHNIQLERLDDAIRDFENSISKCPNFAVSYAQKCYAEHRKAAMYQNPAQLESAVRGYEETVKKFPDFADAHALYAQALCDMGKFEEAEKEFLKALELEPDNATALVHRGLLRLQWKQNLEEAVSLINQAIKLDDKCEYAYEILGTLEVQKGNMDLAMELFNKAINLSKTETEMSHLYSLLDAAQAQLKVARNLGIPLPSGVAPQL